MTDAQPPFFSVIIVSLNGGPVIERVLQSLETTDYPRYEVIVVDNGSTDNMAEIVRQGFPEVRLIQSPVNLGFAGGNNLGIREARGDILVLLNDDTEVRPGWLSAFARAAEAHPDWGIMGCKLLYPDGKTIQHAGGVIHRSGNSHHLGYEQPDDGRFDELLECDYVTGASFAIRRALLERIGPLDDKYFPIYFEETDYCWTTRLLGYKVLYVPDSVVIHHESRTQARFSFRFIYRYNRGRLRFAIKCFSLTHLKGALKDEACWWLNRYHVKSFAPVFCAYMYGLLHLPAYWRARRKYQAWLKEEQT